MDDNKLELLKQQDKDNTYMPHGDVKQADCVIGFSFGYTQAEDGSIQPGKSNRQLAAFIEATFPNTPLLLQFEIDDALMTRNASLVIRQHRQAGQYLGSPEIAEQALIFMRQYGWRTAAIVTHPAMMARNDALCSKLGIITIAPPGLETIEYDSHSAQPWTRDKRSWWQREQQEVIPSYIEQGLI